MKAEFAACPVERAYGRAGHGLGHEVVRLIEGSMPVRLLILCVLCAPMSVASDAETDIHLLEFRAYVPYPDFSADGGPVAPMQVAVTSRGEWDRLWEQIKPERPQAVPKLDFQRHTLLVVASGEKPHGGYFVA